jgi:hypothetical protein
MARRWALGMTGAGAAAAISLFVSAGTASAYTQWTREDGWSISSGLDGKGSYASCHGYQNILEGYANSSHEYQQGYVQAASGFVCQVCIQQFINGNRGAETCYSSSPGGTAVTQAYYDGPGYTDQVSVTSWPSWDDWVSSPY